MTPRPTPFIALAIALAWGIAFEATAFEGEVARFPGDGDVVSPRFEFYIEADGRPEPEEFYRIEVARDEDFEEIALVVDMRESITGWSVGDPLGLDDVPEAYRPQLFQGVHFKAVRKLTEGEYYWRASKARGGGEWESIRGVNRFRIDATPPAEIESLRIDKGADGSLRFHWDPVGEDARAALESVAGYRLYSYTRRLRRYPTLTQYLLAETTEPEYRVPVDPEETPPRIVYYRVQAVDVVGNEIGRRSPRPIGSFEGHFTPPNLEQLTSPDELRRMAAEEPDD